LNAGVKQDMAVRASLCVVNKLTGLSGLFNRLVTLVRAQKYYYTMLTGNKIIFKLRPFVLNKTPQL
jgi:hypothetical protein